MSPLQQKPCPLIGKLPQEQCIVTLLRIDEDSILFSLRVKAETEPFSLYSKRYQYNTSPLTGAFIATNDEINVDFIKKTIKI